MADTKGWNWVDLANLALAGYQTYNNTRAPNFKDPGLTPEQKQLYDLFFKSLTNPTLANNAGDVSNYSRSILGGYGNLGWQSPKTHSGDVGYAGHAPVNFDWSKLPGGSGGSAPSTTAPPGGMGGPTASPSPIPGDPFGHLAAPAGSQGDPFGSLPSGGAGSSGVPSGISSFLDQHPNILQNGAAAAVTALASMLGVPPMIATGLVGMYMKSRGGDSAIPTLPLRPNDVSADNLRPSNITPPIVRQPWQGPYTGTQQPIPSASTGLPGGSYDAMYGGNGGGGPDWETSRMIRQSPLRGLLGVGQRV